MKTWVTRVLLGFVLFTLGYGVGRETALRSAARLRTGYAGSAGGVSAAGPGKAIVTYMHTTFRCVTCNTIERMAKELVESEFGDALGAGLLEWREADFQEQPELAERYDIATSCVVVSREEGGTETGFRRLDEVWTLWEKPSAFNDCLRTAIREYLPEGSSPGSVGGTDG